MAAVRAVQGQREAWKLAQQPRPFTSAWETKSLTSRALCASVSANITQSLTVSVLHPPPHPTPPDSLALRSAAGHVPDPVREVTWGPVFGGPLHLLVPVCAVCHRAFPLQDPAGLQSGETQQHVCVITSKSCFFFPPAVYLLLRLLFSLMWEPLKKFLTSQLFPPSVSYCYGVAACGCFVSTYQAGYREAEAGSSRAYVSEPIINLNQAHN